MSHATRFGIDHYYGEIKCVSILSKPVSQSRRSCVPRVGRGGQGGDERLAQIFGRPELAGAGDDGDEGDDLNLDAGQRGDEAITAFWPVWGVI